MYKIITTLIIILFLFINCKNKKTNLTEDKMSFSRFPQTDNLSFSKVYDYKEGIIGIIQLIDSNLIILNVNNSAKYFINNYSLNRVKLSNGHIRRGKGPGEAIGIIKIGINKKKLWLQDVPLQKILTIDIKSLLSNKPTTDFITEYKIKNHYYMIGFKDTIHYFGIGNKNSSFKIQEVSLTSNKVTKEYGRISTSNNMNLSAYKSVYQSFIYVKPTGDKIVLPYRYLDAIDIFDINSNTELLTHGPEGYDVDYILDGKDMIRTEKTRLSFVNGTVTNDYIYLAYSGLKWKEKNSNFAKNIYVYDWNGNPVKKLNLDRLVGGFTVSDDNKTIYAYDVATGFIVKSNINW